MHNLSKIDIQVLITSNETIHQLLYIKGIHEAFKFNPEQKILIVKEIIFTQLLFPVSCKVLILVCYEIHLEKINTAPLVEAYIEH